MKTILIALAFLPIFVMGQTRVGIVRFEDGSTETLEKLEQYSSPVDTSFYVAHDSLSREMNDSIYLAGGKEVVIERSVPKVSYTLQRMTVEKTTVLGKYQDGAVIVVKGVERKESFPWPLVVLLLASFVLVTTMQGQITFKTFHLLIDDWSDSVMFTLVGGCLSLLSGTLFSFYFLDGGLLVGATVLFVISLVITFLVNSWMRNSWIGGIIVWMSLYLIFWPSSDWVPLSFALSGILLGLPTIYLWRSLKRKIGLFR